MVEVDARGLSCPEPVIQTKRALMSSPKEVTVKVDNNVAKENVKKTLESSGYKVSIKEETEDILLHGTK
ncbi:sulfurtransferase TusA family protein [Filifactor villosus]|uniref:Sulfurtransferase TusA family protein n=1 Tax=Filifactor villosus TaxID=29374 RepID=A0ABV9QLN0_9FIRM